MIVSKIGTDYTLSIPEEFRKDFAAGQEVVIRYDREGGLLILPVSEVKATLLEVFGMWSDREDIPEDGIEYVDQIRSGHRLNDLEGRLDEVA